MTVCQRWPTVGHTDTAVFPGRDWRWVLAELGLMLAYAANGINIFSFKTERSIVLVTASSRMAWYGSEFLVYGRHLSLLHVGKTGSAGHMHLNTKKSSGKRPDTVRCKQLFHLSTITVLTPFHVFMMAR